MVLVLVWLVLLAGLAAFQLRFLGWPVLFPGGNMEDSAARCSWPWPQAVVDAPYPGVTHTLDRSSPDHTGVELLEFDRRVNPGLRLEMYDQDEDDAVPFDDHSRYWHLGVGAVVAHLEQTGRGRVVAAWNGLFFSHREKDSLAERRHLTPVVLAGRAHYTDTRRIRWTFGTQDGPSGQRLKLLHEPGTGALEREFTFAAGGAQALVVEGRPLRLHAFPKPGEPAPPRPVPSTPQDVGHIPDVDPIRTSRTSVGWSRDSTRVFLLVVKEPDSEWVSWKAVDHGWSYPGGWTVPDLQRFWVSFGAWGAVNLDGGDVTQLCYRRADGRYAIVTPRMGSLKPRLTVADPRRGPGGGTLMSFFVRDAGRASATP
ncbi:MAG: phosphodiester glycosidase family protein [Armatimonadetes bacterium]|nr:phosphodiester glycosidase family protein [Armatimonadota bacterium]